MDGWNVKVVATQQQETTSHMYSWKWRDCFPRVSDGFLCKKEAEGWDEQEGSLD